MKPFKSRLFRRIVKPDNLAYWDYLYAEILFRLKQIADLNCPCSKCYNDKHLLDWRISELEKEGKIEINKRPINFTGRGDCGRRLPPRA